MKGIKLSIAAASLFMAVSANAASTTTTFTLAGNLTAYTATIPGLGPLTGVLDYTAPALELTSNMIINSNGVGGGDLSFYLFPEYHSVDLGGLATKTYASMYDYNRTSLSSLVFNSATNHLSGQINNSGAGGGYTGAGGFCVGPTKVCGALNGELGGGVGQVTFDFAFDVALTSFTGTLTSATTLSNGVLVSRTYALNGTSPDPLPGNIPLPMTGALFSSALLALIGIRRRNNLTH